MRVSSLRATAIVSTAVLLGYGGADGAPAPEGGDLVSALLSLPAQPVSAPEGPPSAEPPLESPPPEDAPLDALLDYWAYADQGRKASPIVRRRLLDGCEQHPRRLGEVLALLPDTQEAAERVHRLLERESHPLREGPRWAEDVRARLRRTNVRWRAELTEAAAAATDQSGLVTNSEDLTALAATDTPQAERVLQAHAQGTAPRTKALAVALLHERALRTGKASEVAALRNELQSMACDQALPGLARDIAVRAVLSNPWPGRDDWFLEQLADPTLRSLRDGSFGYGPLQAFTGADLGRWIPTLTRLVNSPDRAVHDGVVSCLLASLEGLPPKYERHGEALPPLLPWLGNPDWATPTTGVDRLRVIQSLSRFRLPAGRTGLLWVVKNDPSSTNRAYAADALRQFCDLEVVSVLRVAARDLRYETDLRLVTGALVACKGVTAVESVRALEAVARQERGASGPAETYVEPDGHSGEGWSSAVDVAIGGHLRQGGPPDAAAWSRFVERLSELEREDVDVHDQMLEMAAEWPSAELDRSLVWSLAGESPRAAAVSCALARRATLRRTTAGELQKLAVRPGLRQGLAAVLLEDLSLSEAILRGSDADAQRALLAASRLVHQALPLPLVVQLLDQRGESVAKAAEAYLLSDDSREAREAVLAHQMGTPRILGADPCAEPTHLCCDSVSLWEARLFDEIRRGEADEIVSYLAGGCMVSGSYPLVIRFRGDQATVAFDFDGVNGAMWRERTLDANEVAELRSLFAEGVDDLPPLGALQSHDTYTQYVHLTPRGGRRVYVWLPPGSAAPAVYRRLDSSLTRLFTGKTEWRYALGRPVEALWTESPRVDSVWATPAGIHVRAEQIGTHGRREPMWWRYSDGALAEPADLPRWLADDGRRDDVPDGMYQGDRIPPLWRAGHGAERIRTGSWRQANGLWICRRGTKPTLLASGEFRCPVVTPDGAWLAAAKARQNWAAPNVVVRIERSSGRELPVDLPASDTLDPVTYLPAHRAFLVIRATDAQPPAAAGTPEHYLVDPDTGKARLVAGEFAPLDHEQNRPLQPTGRDLEFWAAIPDPTGTATRVGRYDIRSFSFQSVTELPGIAVTSDCVWIDEPARRLYVVYGGQLLRLPLDTSRGPGGRKRARAGLVSCRRAVDALTTRPRVAPQPPPLERDDAFGVAPPVVPKEIDVCGAWDEPHSSTSGSEDIQVALLEVGASSSSDGWV